MGKILKILCEDILLLIYKYINNTGSLTCSHSFESVQKSVGGKLSEKLRLGKSPSAPANENPPSRGSPFTCLTHISQQWPITKREQKVDTPCNRYTPSQNEINCNKNIKKKKQQ